MSRTRIYTVHVRAWSTSGDREAVFVREGFSWLACVFSFLWMLAHRLWLPAALLLVASLGIGLVGDVIGLDPLTDAMIGIAVALLVGWEAHNWWRRDLERRGFVTAGVVAAPDLAEAERRFFARPR